MSEIIILFLGAISAGLLGSLTGLGGGVIIIPLLTLGFGVPMHYAIGASLISVIGTSSGAAVAFVKEGFTNMRIGMFLEIATTAGAIIGALVSGMLNPNTIGIIFASILLLTVILNLKGKPDHQEPLIKGSLEEKLKLFGTFPDKGVLKSYSARNTVPGFLMMMFAGAMSGLLGIGSGALKVLAMDNMMKLPFKVSTTTSNFMIGVTAVASALIYFQRGEIIPVIVAPVLIGVVIGSFIGSKTLMVSKTKKLKVFFAIVITILSIYMMYNGINKSFR
ncbi:sulfite exporter TauE/SafE family protein [Chryseobacterium indologenes]|uniref:Probable membrane transporter protein n=1 Tax=Chryseobacterium indologenes TaxID=253 RepID=A0A1Z3W3C0_CHRID|nr:MULTISPECIES: sulfite exporter TauE/SafE family protein [Chryseobacterium]ASE62201.1 sulfite exporter TauE/SafE family protein [Chryseobacterium indologenes]ATN06038.1 sulfite exporter TauE/SafE family protein [Chryseobacterium indologenes]AYY85201.1 sulfite exporter TauE/SafE family protein [Chryseobacterium indologenes]AYZ34874.1 sulfite exporter TauE/SafE family protein [Chryseobacterium indologenes]AZB17915.1 sulfite exporter TauE/SafE family protein [Chryseobacterium indologenes]